MLAAAGRSRIVTLDIPGKPWTTEQLAVQLEAWKLDGRDVALLVGGPEGLSPECKAAAEQSWSLSPLTLPHPLVRVLVAESPIAPGALPPIILITESEPCAIPASPSHTRITESEPCVIPASPSHTRITESGTCTIPASPLKPESQSVSMHICTLFLTCSTVIR